MARKRKSSSSRSSKRKGAPRFPTIPQREVFGLLLIAFGAILLFSMITGAKTDFIAGLITLVQLVTGWGAVLVASFCVGFGIILLLLPEQLKNIDWYRVVGAEILALSILSLAHFVAASSSPEEAALLAVAKRGAGGGYIGWALSAPLADALGWGGTILIFAFATLIGVVMTFKITWADIRKWSAMVSALLARVFAKASLANLREQIEEGRAIAERVQNSEIVTPSTNDSPSGSRQDDQTFEPLPELSAQPRVTAIPLTPNKKKRAVPIIKSRTKVQKKSRKKSKSRERDDTLPPLDLLDSDSSRPFSEADIRRHSTIIEQTLASFNIPVQVREVNQGPTVTQYGIEPGFVERKSRSGKVSRRKVRVSKITSLADDLALALAASPIRIEAPIPGKPYVGIEVPNKKAEIVTLRAVLESDEFNSIRSKLRIALGRDVSGQTVAADLVKMPHLLIAGATGSGKSVCLNSIIASLLFENHPAEVQLLMIDPKRVELVQYDDIPHLLAPVMVELENVVATLHGVVAEMQQRYKILSAAKARDIERYNKKSDTPLPYIIVLIDELADLMMLAPAEIEQAICRIAQMSRATGIHLVISTQRPSVDVITGLIKANFPARISFATTSQTDSRVILDTVGAEKLLGRGDMLFMSPDSSSLLRMQGCYVSDKELKKLVRFWKNQ